jgi:hypothetical protein
VTAAVLLTLAVLPALPETVGVKVAEPVPLLVLLGVPPLLTAPVALELLVWDGEVLKVPDCVTVAVPLPLLLSVAAAVKLLVTVWVRVLEGVCVKLPDSDIV